MKSSYVNEAINSIGLLLYNGEVELSLDDVPINRFIQIQSCKKCSTFPPCKISSFQTILKTMINYGLLILIINI